MSNVERKEEPMEEEISLFDAIGRGDLKKVQSIKDIKLFHSTTNNVCFEYNFNFQ